ncbi:hypothetical protein [Pedobacter flavus]|uniref:PBCV-specific basic adaptor domain-containing protein n=1 Tax=Pedobacter flavus TaxID=3113906 RepID=A0ABU7H197_9SPHI|nr:hypothetical protein [Pedobacter sp. VNH31]MEE1884935.1 hypothetical protein [Pedobacter sp. VNH31]
MKNKISIILLAIVWFALSPAITNAQEKKTEVGKVLKKTGNAVEKGAKAVGDKSAEVAVKGASKVADQTYKGKMAPDGSNVYIDGKNNKYYIDKKGAKIYLKASQIRDRPKS